MVGRCPGFLENFILLLIGFTSAKISSILDSVRNMSAVMTHEIRLGLGVHPPMRRW